MAFLTTADILTSIYQEHLDAITRDDDTYIAFAIDAAEMEMIGYLAPKYDVDAIFAKTGSDRNKLIVMLCRDMAVFHLLNLSNPGVDYASKKDRYDRAVRWCEQVQKGKIDPPELELDDTDITKNEVLMSSNTKRTSHY